MLTVYKSLTIFFARSVRFFLAFEDGFMLFSLDKTSRANEKFNDCFGDATIFLFWQVMFIPDNFNTRNYATMAVIIFIFAD